MSGLPVPLGTKRTTLQLRVSVTVRTVGGSEYLIRHERAGWAASTGEGGPLTPYAVSGPPFHQAALRLADRLGLDLELHLLADQHATGLQRLVPGDAEVLAVDLGGGGEADDLLAPGAHGQALELDVQRHLAGHAADGELAGELEVLALRLGQAGAAEDDLRVLLGFQEVAAAQVVVAVDDARLDACRRHVHLDAGLQRVLGDRDLA